MKKKEKNLNDSLPALSLDAVLKDFFQRKERLTDLLNAALLEGELFIRPDMVETMDSDSSSLVELEEGRFHTAKRLRDKLHCIRIKKGERFIIGTEFQSTVDYRMILRMLYYICDTLSREEKLRSTIPNIVSLVVYTKEGRWNAKTSLKEFSERIEDERLNELFFDFSYQICDIKELDTEKLRNKEVRDAIEGIQLVYAGTEGILKERREISKASLLVIVAATGRMELYDEIIKKEGERFIMCEAFERWMKENKEIGRIEGKLEGKIEGIEEGERNYCIKMLKKKLGVISEETQLGIMNSKPLQFEQLSDNLFSISDEGEIKSYLN